MNGAHCVFATATMPRKYGPYEVWEIAHKQTLMVHRTTGATPFSEWHGCHVNFPSNVCIWLIGPHDKKPKAGETNRTQHHGVLLE